MTNTGTTVPELNPEQKENLQYEYFISCVVNQRGLTSKQFETIQDNIGKGRTTPFWKSAGGSALITVLIGGILTGLIANEYQTLLKEREFEDNIIQLYSATILEIHKENLISRSKSLFDALRLLGRAISRSQSRIDIDGELFAQRKNAEEQQVLDDQKQQVRKAFNEAWEELDTNKNALKSALSIFFGGDVSSAWQNVTAAVDDFIICANSHIPIAPNSLDECTSKYSTVSNNMEMFLDRIKIAEPVLPALRKSQITSMREVFSQDCSLSFRCILK